VNAGGNLWNLYEVRKALGISPYNRNYFALWIPSASAVSAVLLMRFSTGSASHPWLVIGLSLLVAYSAFVGFAGAFALDQDDRMIARSAWSQMRLGMQKFGAKP
jgi:hypothetical protein